MGYAAASAGYGPQYGGAAGGGGAASPDQHAAMLRQQQVQAQHMQQGAYDPSKPSGEGGDGADNMSVDFESGQEGGVDGQTNQPLDLTALSQLHDDNTVPTVFRWEHGGRQVYITGTFNGWSRQIPMHRSGNDFTYIHNLKRGKHAFKFIIDNEWRFAPDQPTVADIDGRINNFIDVTDFKPYTGDRDFERERQAAECGTSSLVPPHPTPGQPRPTPEQEAEAAEQAAAAAAAAAEKHGPDKDADGEAFTTTVPDLDDYTKEPPPLPPHLRHIILNKPPQLQDTAALPVPQHVALNHLYCTAIKDNMMVLGITQRYKTKFVTNVYYSPCS